MTSQLVFERRRVVFPGVLLIGRLLYSLYKKPKTLGKGFSSILRNTSSKRRPLYRLRMVCIGVMLSSSILLLMKPVWSQETQETTKEGIDIVIALDVSGSMGADDFAPDRLSVAKQNVENFVSRLESDRVGLVVFAGKPFTSVPLTFDYEITSQIVEQLSTQTIDQTVRGLNGTAIGDAIVASLGILEKGLEEEEQEREQVVILVTDGDATAGTLDPQLASAYAVEQGVTIYTVAVGSLEGGSIEYSTPFGVRRQPVGGVDEQMLKSIANRTGGTYRRATDEQTFQQIFDELSGLTKTEIKTESIKTSLPALQWLERAVLVCAIGLLILASMGYSLSRLSISKKVTMGLAISLVIIASVVVWIDPLSQELPTQQEVSVVLDVSRSMQVQDITYRGKTISRLQAAKTFIQRAVDSIGDAKRGMQVFAGASTTVLPITNDRELFLTFLQGVDRESVLEGGSDLGVAVGQAIDRFVENDTSIQRRVILISDGGEDSVVLDEQTLQRIQEQSIELIVIGVGTEKGGPIIEGVDRFGNPIVTQYQGQTVISALGEDILESLSTQGGGVYERLESIEDITDLLALLSSQAAVLLASRIGGGWQDIFLVLMIMIVVVYIQTPRMKGKSFFGISLLS